MNLMRKTKIFTGFTLFSLLALFFTGCGDGNLENKAKDPSRYEESLVKANKESVRVENQQIDDYVGRHHMDMQQTGTGIRWMVFKKGIGAQAVNGKTARLAYTLTLLTGDTVYSAAKDGPLVFEIGKGQVISGLEEAILLLRVGDRAKFIIPSHLAFGLLGDQDKIPQKATLVYDVEFISMF